MKRILLLWFLIFPSAVDAQDYCTRGYCWNGYTWVWRGEGQPTREYPPEIRRPFVPEPDYLREYRRWQLPPPGCRATSYGWRCR